MKKSFICLFISLALILPLCSCNSRPPAAPSATSLPQRATAAVTDAGTAAQPGWLKHADEPLTLSWYINFSWFTSAWGGNLVSDTITSETGVRVDFITPSGNEREKLDAMLESKMLPDFVTLGHWEPEISRFIDEGLVYPLNELADKYDPYFFQVANPERVAWYTYEDGNLYVYPNSSYTPSDYERHDNIGSNMGFLVRKDIYEAIGSPDMTTPDGFAQAIRDASEQFPTTNGKPLIPIGLYDFDKTGCFSLNDILMDFLAIPYEKDGVLYDRYTDADYITWLKTFRALASSGYIKNEVFVDKRAQMAEKVAEGRYFCMLYQHTDIADQQKLLYDKNPNMVYIAVDGPRNAKGDDHTLSGVGINGWTVTLISKNCKHPDRAIQFLSYLMSEHGQKLTFLGVEGETYDMVDGHPVIRADVFALQNSDRVEYNKRYSADNTYWMLQDLAMQLDWQLPAEPPLAQPQQWTHPYTVYTVQQDPSFGTNADAANASMLIKEEWGRTLPKLLLAKSDEEFDALFAEYLKRRDVLGFDIVTAAAAAQMNAAKAKLNALRH